MIQQSDVAEVWGEVVTPETASTCPLAAQFTKAEDMDRQKEKTAHEPSCMTVYVGLH